MASYVSNVEVENTINTRPHLLDFTPWALDCLVFDSEREGPASPLTPAPTVVSQDSVSTVDSLYAVSESERIWYYYGITNNGEHPDLLYRTGSDKYPWIEPTGRYAYHHEKSVRQVYGTPLNNVWKTAGPKIFDLVKSAVKTRFSIDPARFLTHGRNGEEDILGPVVVWVAVYPGTTMPDTAHDISHAILELLKRYGVEDVEVEWQEAVTSRLIGPRLLRVVGDDDPTVHLRRHLTAALGIPITSAEREKEDAQGTVGFFFHENRDKDGNPSNRVFGVTNHHVLRKKVEEKYEFKGAGAPAQYVRVSGYRRFQQGLDEIRLDVSRRLKRVEVYTRNIIALEQKGTSEDEEEAEEDMKQLRETRQNLEKEIEAIPILEKFYNTLMAQWGDLTQRNIGHVHYSPPISVDVQACFTEDWATFELIKEKFEKVFEGNVVDLGTGISSVRLIELMSPQNDIREGFEYPVGRKMRIRGIVSEELLASPDLFDGQNQPCFIVLKHGSATDLTCGRYAGLESFLCNENGVKSVELAIYNCDKESYLFSDRGDSGSLVFDSLGRMFAVIHSGKSKNDLTSAYVTNCSPCHWLIPRIIEKYPYADFNHEKW